MAQVLADPEPTRACGDDRARRRVRASGSRRCPCTSSSACSLDDLAVTDAELPRRSIVGGASIYPFVQNLLLALRAEGLGAAMTTLLVPAEEEVRELLGIPERSRSPPTSASVAAPTRGRSSSRAGRSRSSPSASAGASRCSRCRGCAARAGAAQAR